MIESRGRGVSKSPQEFLTTTGEDGPPDALNFDLLDFHNRPKAHSMIFC